MSNDLTAEAVEVLKKATIDGMVVKLPNIQLERKLYLEVANRLELIGGKWKSGKVSGFVFQQDPTELLEQISNGEKRNLKKEYQFFGTNAELADELVDYAEIELYHEVSEPSAGQGAIIDAICRKHPSRKHSNKVIAFELMDINRLILERNGNCILLDKDFLNTENDWSGKFDRIVANPPFSKNADILHIYKMYECLKPNGRIVTIASKHWQFSKNKKETAFKEWLESLGVEPIDVPAGAFKEAGTNIATCILVINKPA